MSSCSLYNSHSSGRFASKQSSRAGCGHLQCPWQNLRSWAWRSGSCSHPCAPSSSALATSSSCHTPPQPSAEMQSHNTVTTQYFRGSDAEGDRNRVLLKLGHVLVASCEPELPRWSWPPSLDVNESSVCVCVSDEDDHIYSRKFFSESTPLSRAQQILVDQAFLDLGHRDEGPHGRFTRAERLPHLGQRWKQTAGGVKRWTRFVSSVGLQAKQWITPWPCWFPREILLKKTNACME